jgi:hypothetical protein
MMQRCEVVVEGITPSRWDVVIMLDGKEWRRHASFNNKYMADECARQCVNRVKAVAEKYWGKLEPKR